MQTWRHFAAVARGGQFEISVAVQKGEEAFDVAKVVEEVVWIRRFELRTFTETAGDCDGTRPYGACAADVVRGIPDDPKEGVGPNVTRYGGLRGTRNVIAVVVVIPEASGFDEEGVEVEVAELLSCGLLEVAGKQREYDIGSLGQSHKEFPSAGQNVPRPFCQRLG